MKKVDVLVIGGSAAGLPAAITARRHYPEKSILLLREEKQVLIPCGIPYIYGTVGSTQNNLIPDAPLEANKIELVVDKATELDPNNRIIRTSGGEEIHYDKLVLGTGSLPMVLPIPGLDKKNVFTIKKDVPYLDQLDETLKNVKDLVILGGGFIGVEFADECNKRGDINVTIVEMLPHCLMLAFEEDLCAEAEETLKDRGVNMICGAKLEEVLGDEAVTGVRLADGRTIKADALIVGIGVRPNDELAKNAGLETDRGGIIVDEHQRTSNEHIFACGDCTSKKDFFTGGPSKLKLASIASMESRIAGANLYETKRKNPGVVGVFATAIGEKTFAMAGMSEKNARDSGIEPVTGNAEAANRHPGGMPGMAKMKIKLVFDKNTKAVIGGQIRGGPSTGEVINMLSTCIQKKMTADELATFQLGTHPAVTASPIAYQIVNAAEMAIKNM